MNIATTAAPEPLLALRIVSPALVLLSALSISPSPITPVVVASRTPRRATILALLSLSGLTFFLDGLTFVVYAVLRKVWPAYTGIEVNAVLGLIAFAGLAALGAWKDIQGVDVWTLTRLKLSILVAFALDLAQIVLLGSSLHGPFSIESLLHFVFPAFRVLVLNGDHSSRSETSLLLPAEEGAAPSTGLAPVSAENGKYGTFRPTARSTLHASGPTTRTHTPAPSSVAVSPLKGRDVKEEVALDPSWSEIIARIRRISPYLWPSKSFALQTLAAFCIVVVLIGRVVNILVPWVFAELVHMFEEGAYTTKIWIYLFAYVGLRFLQASGGLSALRETLWAPVMQYSDREMSQLSFEHLLNLSFAFHLRRKTGEILRILDRGAAINRAFELLLFNVIPTFIDIAIALVLFAVWFEWTLTLVVFLVMAAYVSASVILTRWRTRLRRQMVDRDVITRGIHTDCLLNYETVKYFCGEQHEADRYSDAIRAYQSLEYKVILSLNLLNLVQNFIITLGLLVGSMIVALRVTRGQSKSYEFVFFITYLAQLYGPLNMLGTIYRSINQTLVDTEKLLKLLNEPTEVNDKPDAPDLIVTDGEIAFENVSFSYDGRNQALSNVSFKVPKGSSVALVGESGGGKSTVLRLLYRFYDLHEGDGRILIDGQDIRDVTQLSLRKAIGVVPQDSVLFNASIAYNIGYGRFGATSEDIEAAAKAAQMHERILSFPDGYDTRVGERGVRLSGGEKQRVAIARTLLKNPPILLLDEATSALDTATEKDIQKALQHLAEGRSSLAIAHRLSVHGQIVEQGNHSELLALNGEFAKMWAAQVQGAEDVPSAASLKKEGASGYSVEDSTTKEGTEPAVEHFVDSPGAVDAELAQIDAEGGHEAAEGISGDDVADTPAVEPGAEATETPSGAAPDEAGAEVSAPSAAEHSQEATAASVGEDDQAPVAFPSDAADGARPSADGAAPVAFPGSGASAPVAFPGGDDGASQKAMSIPERAQTPQHTQGVTFQDAQSLPHSGAASPDPDGKRRRTLSTQGIQRFARRLSTRGDSVSSTPGKTGGFMAALRREGTTGSKDDGSSKDARESPAASVSSDIGQTKKLSKKLDKKKDKRKSVSGGV
ncbi:uncharacterized protein B0H18DRAFT_1010688 [Fomitopsis serialis]|uniref:uncharacterized protein n=1 Tax=Fomitopsis serialis TaxID=139415 RepID=UPI0020074E6A|nr:uncharacterized protein B0H18DRAFT_1010688 [Neoantrodia serialis]KAH9924903.1 hypothetical protein B0H18DRAFT_1010688 [Neoantrodia serialis]